MQISEHHSIVAGKGRSLLNINPRTETILTCSGKFFTEVDIHSNAVICRQILPFAPTDMFVAQSGTLLIFFDGTATFHCMQKHGPSLRLLSRLRLSSSFEKLRPFQMAVSPIEAKLAIVYPHSNKLLLLSLLHTISDKKKGTLLKPTIFTVKHDKDLICVAFHPSRPIFITSSSDSILRIYDSNTNELLSSIDESALSGDSKNRAVYRCIAVSRSDIKPRSSQTKSGFGAFEVGSAAVPDLLAVGDTSGKLWCWNISDPKAPVFAGARRIDPTHSLVHISFSPSSETCSMIIMADDGSCQSYAYSSPDTLRDADGALIPPPTKMDDYSGIMKSDILVPFSIPVSKSTAPPNTPKALHFPLFRTPPIQFHDSSDIILIPAKQKNTLYTYSHSFHTAVQPLVVITSYPVSFFFNPQPFPDRGLITPTEIAHPVVNIPELSSIAECSNEATLPSLDVLLRASAFPINPTIPFFSSFGQFSLYFYNSQRTVPSQVLPPLLTVDLPGSQAGTPKPGQKPASRQIRLHPIRVQGSLFHPYVLVLLEAVSSQQTIGWESVVYFAVVKPPSALTPDEEMEAFDPSVVQQNMPCVLIPPTPCRDATFVGPNNDTNVAAITVDGAMLSLYSFALPTPEQLAGVKKGLCPLVFKKEWSQPLPTISDRFFSTPMGGGSCLLYHETTNGNRLVLSAGAAQWCVKGHRTRLLRSSSRIAPMSRFTSFASTPAAHSQTTSLITVGFSNVTEYLPPRGSFVVRPVATGDSDIVEEKVGEIVLQSEEIPLSVEWVRLPADPTVTWDDHEEKTKGEPIITQIANKQDVQIRAIGAIMTTLRIIIVDSTLHVLKTITRTEHSCPPMYNKAIPYFTSIKWVSTALFYTTPNHLFFTTISPAIEPLLVAPFPYTNAVISAILPDRVIVASNPPPHPLFAVPTPTFTTIPFSIFTPFVLSLASLPATTLAPVHVLHLVDFACYMFPPPTLPETFFQSLFALRRGPLAQYILTHFKTKSLPPFIPTTRGSASRYDSSLFIRFTSAISAGSIDQAIVYAEEAFVELFGDLQNKGQVSPTPESIFRTLLSSGLYWFLLRGLVDSLHQDKVEIAKRYAFLMNDNGVNESLANYLKTYDIYAKHDSESASECIADLDLHAETLAEKLNNNPDARWDVTPFTTHPIKPNPTHFVPPTNLGEAFNPQSVPSSGRNSPVQTPEFSIPHILYASICKGRYTRNYAAEVELAKENGTLTASTRKGKKTPQYPGEGVIDEHRFDLYTIIMPPSGTTLSQPRLLFGKKMTDPEIEEFSIHPKGYCVDRQTLIPVDNTNNAAPLDDWTSLFPSSTFVPPFNHISSIPNPVSLVDGQHLTDNQLHAIDALCLPIRTFAVSEDGWIQMHTQPSVAPTKKGRKAPKPTFGGTPKLTTKGANLSGSAANTNNLNQSGQSEAPIEDHFAPIWGDDGNDPKKPKLMITMKEKPAEAPKEGEEEHDPENEGADNGFALDISEDDNPQQEDYREETGQGTNSFFSSNNDFFTNTEETDGGDGFNSIMSRQQSYNQTSSFFGQPEVADASSSFFGDFQQGEREEDQNQNQYDQDQQNDYNDPFLQPSGYAPSGEQEERDPYSSDPYSTDPGAQEERDPYSSDPYSSDPYSNDPYASDTYGNDPYTNDPYSRDPYSNDPYTQDPYSNDPYTHDPYSNDNTANDPYTNQSYENDPYLNNSYDHNPYSNDQAQPSPAMSTYDNAGYYGEEQQKYEEDTSYTHTDTTHDAHSGEHSGLNESYTDTHSSDHGTGYDENAQTTYGDTEQPAHTDTSGDQQGYDSSNQHQYTEPDPYSSNQAHDNTDNTQHNTTDNYDSSYGQNYGNNYDSSYNQNYGDNYASGGYDYSTQSYDQNNYDQSYYSGDYNQSYGQGNYDYATDSGNTNYGQDSYNQGDYSYNYDQTNTAQQDYSYSDTQQYDQTYADHTQADQTYSDPAPTDNTHTEAAYGEHTDTNATEASQNAYDHQQEGEGTTQDYSHDYLHHEDPEQGEFGTSDQYQHAEYRTHEQEEQTYSTETEHHEYQEEHHESQEEHHETHEEHHESHEEHHESHEDNQDSHEEHHNSHEEHHESHEENQDSHEEHHNSHEEHHESHEEHHESHEDNQDSHEEHHNSHEEHHESHEENQDSHEEHHNSHEEHHESHEEYPESHEDHHDSHEEHVTGHTEQGSSATETYSHESHEEVIVHPQEEHAHHTEAENNNAEKDILQTDEDNAPAEEEHVHVETEDHVEKGILHAEEDDSLQKEVIEHPEEEHVSTEPEAHVEEPTHHDHEEKQEDNPPTHSSPEPEHTQEPAPSEKEEEAHDEAQTQEPVQTSFDDFFGGTQQEAKEEEAHDEAQTQEPVQTSFDDFFGGTQQEAKEEGTHDETQTQEPVQTSFDDFFGGTQQEAKEEGTHDETQTQEPVQTSFDDFFGGTQQEGFGFTNETGESSDAVNSFFGTDTSST